MQTKHRVNMVPMDYVNLRRLQLLDGSEVYEQIKHLLVASSKAHGGTVTEDTDLLNAEVEVNVLRQVNAVKLGLLITPNGFNDGYST